MAASVLVVAATFKRLDRQLYLGVQVCVSVNKACRRCGSHRFEVLVPWNPHPSPKGVYLLTWEIL